MPKDHEVKITITGDSRSAEQALKRVSDHGHRLGTALKVGLAAAGAGVAAFTAFMKSSVDAAAEEEKAITMLAQSMKQHGTYSEAALADLKEFAAEQQRFTTFADDATLAAMHQLQTFGMNTEQMKAATKAAQDLAAAKGIDLTTAANLVGRAFAGNTGMMSRYGIVLDESRLKAEGFSYVLEALNNQFGGAARAALDTYEGRLEKMKNYYGDLKETIGYAVLPALSDMAENLTEFFGVLKDSDAISKFLKPISEAFEKLAPLVADALSSIIDLFSESDILGQITEVFSGLLESLIPIIQQIGPPIMEIASILADLFASALSSLAPIISQIASMLAPLISTIADFLREHQPMVEELMAILSEILTRVLEAIAPVLDTILDSAMKIIDVVMPVLPALLELLEPILQALEAILPPISQLVEWMAKVAEVVMDKVVSAFEWLVERLRGLGSVWSAVWGAAKAVFEGVWNAIKWIYDHIISPVANAIKSVWDGLIAAWQRVWSVLKSIVKGAVLGVLHIVRGLVHALDWAIPGGATGKVDEWIAKVERWHAGGLIGSKERLIIAEVGEYVVRSEAVKKVGVPTLDYINRTGNLPAGGNVEVNFNVGTLISSDESWEELARKIHLEYGPRIARAVGGIAYG